MTGYSYQASTNGLRIKRRKPRKQPSQAKSAIISKDLLPKYFKSKEWQERKANHLQRHPHCSMCDHRNSDTKVYYAPYAGHLKKTGPQGMRTLCDDHAYQLRQDQKALFE